MAFHSWQYALLLATTLVVYWLLANQRTARYVVLSAASLLFYGAFAPWFLWLLLFSSVLDWFVGLKLGEPASRARRRAWLCCSLAGNLGLLAYFKYSGWVASLVDPLLESAGIGARLAPLAWSAVVPVGISFYTFQTLSYTIDVWRGNLKTVRSPLDFLLFVSFFPQLVAGPIVRAIDFLPQLDLVPRLDRARMHAGLWRIGIGLAKKTLLADQVGQLLVDPVYQRPDAYHPLLHLAAVYGFAFQIYCDFSGYSDIAIGSARLFGFELLENFDAPYRARSQQEFWRRWHISLSSWVRDYLYYPLGGSRGTEPRVAFNLMVTMVIIGLWHGASNLWLVYGLLQGAALVIERFLERRRGHALSSSALGGALAWFLAFHFTAFTEVLIRASSFEDVRKLAFVHGDSLEVSPWAWLALAVAALSHFLPPAWIANVARAAQALPTAVLGVLLGVLAGVLFLVANGQTSFIYFQF